MDRKRVRFAPGFLRGEKLGENSCEEGPQGLGDMKRAIFTMKKSNSAAGRYAYLLTAAGMIGQNVHFSPTTYEG